jgi:outer membrane protein TolC
MRRAALFLALSCALPAGSATLTFEEVLARATAARGIASSPADALQLLENPAPREWPVVRAEGTFSNARNVDLFSENLVHSRVFSALVSADYPLLDGGMSRIRRDLARLDGAAFRQRVRELEEEAFDETLDAAARLYLAQERHRILREGFQRALALDERASALLQDNTISNLTAAQWQDKAAAAELELLDLELERLKAQTRLKLLIDDASSEPLEIVLALDDSSPSPSAAADDSRSAVLLRQRQLALDEARAARRPQMMLSAFGGVATVGTRDKFSLYGLRMTLSLPMLDASVKRRVAQARLQAAEAELASNASVEQLRRRAADESLTRASLANRVELLTKALDVARRRAESMARLTSAGLRSESNLADAWVDVARRESDLLGARVELWRLRTAGVPPAGTAASRRRRERDAPGPAGETPAVLPER